MTQSNLTIFVVSSGLLLFMPGPTNAVMMASGAASGFRRSMPMTLVALAGYASAIAILLAIGASAGMHGREFSLTLKAAAAIVMAVMAFKLWVKAAGNSPVPRKPSVGDVLSLTLLNPKAMILAFGVMQPVGEPADLVAKCSILGALVILSAACWIGVGAGTRTLSAVPNAFVARSASVILACFALYFLSSVFREIDLQHAVTSITAT